MLFTFIFGAGMAVEEKVLQYHALFPSIDTGASNKAWVRIKRKADRISVPAYFVGSLHFAGTCAGSDEGQIETRQRKAAAW